MLNLGFFLRFFENRAPGRPEMRQMRRLVARVSQLPLAETHKLLTIPCISDTSCQQLVRQRLLLHGLQRPSMNRALWCRLWHPKPLVYLSAKEWRCSRPGVFCPCEPDQLALSLPECPLRWRRGLHTCLGRDVSPLGWEHVYTRNHDMTWHDAMQKLMITMSSHM